MVGMAEGCGKLFAGVPASFVASTGQVVVRRAATLAGGEPYHYNASERGWRGNPDRQLWKSACEKIAERAAQHRERGGATHEAALYAALAASRESHELVLAGTLIAADCL